MTTNNTLKGLRVLVCRPGEKAAGLVARLTEAGAQVRSLPTLSIEAVPEQDQAVKQAVMSLDRFQHVIFISESAARFGADWIDRYWPQLPLGIQWYAIGDKTARTVRRLLPLSEQEIQQPVDGIDSEALVQLPGLQGSLANESVLIFRGVGGRPHLGEALAGRGAKICYAQVYRRVQPEYSEGDLRRDLSEFDPHLLVCLSAETANNLSGLAERVRFDLSTKSFIMPSKRAVEECVWLSSAHCIIPKGLAESDIAFSINAWWQPRDFIKVGE